MSEPLLSICIPTYNRADILDDTLSALFSNPDFDPNLVEVIVSDNCSTDRTKDVVAKYPLVRYFRNDENIKDKNFSKVLGYATGRYIRLFNDTLSFKLGILGWMLNVIQENSHDKSNLFFYASALDNKYGCKKVKSKSQLLKEVSFYTTWIANFGTWRNLFEVLVDKDKYADLQFTQVDWTYRLVENHASTKIYFEDLFDVATPKGKGGYNLFDTFVNKYLYLIKQEALGVWRYEVEKYRLYRYFVFPWMLNLFGSQFRNYDYLLDNGLKIILLKYWYELYLYPSLIFFVQKSLCRRVR